MVKTIGTAGSRDISHSRCGKGIATVVNGIPQVMCVRKECKELVPLNGFIERDPLRKAVDLLMSGKVNPADVIALSDPFADYHQIDRLFFVGPQELDKLFRKDPVGNPLDLKEGWIPEPPAIDGRLDTWIRSCVWRDDPQWRTRAALVLCPKAIGSFPTSLVGQTKLFGVAHDEIPAGIVRSDVFWSNWFVRPNYTWANEPASDDWEWVFVYEHADWTARKSWNIQKKVAKDKGSMSVVSATQDAWALNIVRAYYGVSLRLGTWSRTSTLCDGYPLYVYSDGDGVSIHQLWDAQCARDNVGLSVQGVP